jgi:hypothetical protein
MVDGWIDGWIDRKECELYKFTIPFDEMKDSFIVGLVI